MGAGIRRVSILGLALLTGCAEASEILVIHNVTVIDGASAQPQAGMTVMIEDGWIRAISTGDSASHPRGARMIDGSGKFLIPGLWDMHVHLRDLEGTLPLFVINGVTTVRDMGSVLEETVALREAVAAGTRVGPRILTAGLVVESASWVSQYVDLLLEQGADEDDVEAFLRTRVTIADTLEARAVVELLTAGGADFIKIRHAESREVFAALAAAAEAAGTHLVGHYVWIMGLDTSAELGQRSIEHNVLPGFEDRSSDDKRRIFETLRRSGTHLVPTLVTNASQTAPLDQVRRLTRDRTGAIDPRMAYVSNGIRRSWMEAVEVNARDSTRPPPDVIAQVMASSNRFLLEAVEAGVPILAGTDAPTTGTYFGFSLHDELALLVETFGMSPMEALRSASALPAAFMDVVDSVGTIEVGKRADLVLLDADPLADIRNTTRIDAVIVAGRLFDHEERMRVLDDIATAIADQPATLRNAIH